MRILLVEDDAMIGSSLLHALRDDGYVVDWVPKGSEAVSLCDGCSCAYSLVLLDWNLPGESGLDVLRRMRKSGCNAPVLMLTARDRDEDLVLGLDSGADDYLTKPFRLSELRARIRALLRRPRNGRLDTLRYGGVELDLAQHLAQLHGQPVGLTPKEFALLHALVAAAPAVLSRAQLERRIYGWDEEVASNAIEFLIHGLRRKLGAGLVQNVRGVGWRLQEET